MGFFCFSCPSLRRFSYWVSIIRSLKEVYLHRWCKSQQNGLGTKQGLIETDKIRSLPWLQPLCFELLISTCWSKSVRWWHNVPFSSLNMLIGFWPCCKIKGFVKELWDGLKCSMDFFPFLDSSSGFAMRLGISFVCSHNTDGSVRASHLAARGSNLSARIFFKWNLKCWEVLLSQ